MDAGANPPLEWGTASVGEEDLSSIASGLVEHVHERVLGSVVTDVRDNHGSLGRVSDEDESYDNGALCIICLGFVGELFLSVVVCVCKGNVIEMTQFNG